MNHEKRTPPPETPPPNGAPQKTGLEVSWGQFRKFMEDSTPIPDDPKLLGIYLAGYVAGVRCGSELQRDLWNIVRAEYTQLVVDLNLDSPFEEKKEP